MVEMTNTWHSCKLMDKMNGLQSALQLSHEWPKEVLLKSTKLHVALRVTRLNINYEVFCKPFLILYSKITYV